MRRSDATPAQEQPDNERGFPRIGYSPSGAATAASVSRTRIFTAIKDGQLQARKLGKATVIERSELERWLRSMPTRGRRAEEEDAA